MPPVVQSAVPPQSLLRTYRGGRNPELWQESGDCFSVVVDRHVSLADFVAAFYTTPVFRVERAILRVVARAPSTDAQARAVAEGGGARFAVWEVGERSPTQLLMCDRYGKTRSWFYVQRLEQGGTLLHFGSAVVASRNRRTGTADRGRAFRWLLGFHVLYSTVLLAAARRRLLASRGP